MDDLSNPYTPGAGSRPPELAGRDPEIEAFDLLMGRLERGHPERSPVFQGLRGVGKTVLLNELEDRATERGWGVGMMEAKTTTDFRREIADVARSALRSVSRQARARDALLNAAQFLKAFSLTATSGGGVSAQVDLEAALGSAPGQDIERDMVDLFFELGRAARANATGIVFFIDEMQLLAREDLEALLAALHRAGQKNLPIALVGAGLPVLRSRLAAAKSYSERLIVQPSLGPLSEEAARRALERPAKTALEDAQVTFEPEAVALVLEFSEGYPFFLQAHGKFCWSVADSSVITAADAERARGLAQAELDSDFFETRFVRATPKQREYLAAMAELGSGPRAAREIATAAGYSGPKAASVARSGLIDLGLIYDPEPGQLDFTVPRFAEFMCRKHPSHSL